jgi:ABC-type Mn2+/Zn2+ transport system ATPase subunit
MKVLKFPYSQQRPHTLRTGPQVLEVCNLNVVYPNTNQLALQDIHLCVPQGARVGLVGHNGAGKSTLLKAIAGLLQPQRGSISIYDDPITQCRNRIAYLPQRSELDWRFPISLRRLVLAGRYVHLGWLARPTAADWQIADRYIEALGLSDLRDRQISQLSGGQQQRVLLARTLTQEADMLLLDEPLNAVDQQTRDIISTVLSELPKQNKTVLTATHELNNLQRDFDSVVYLANGRMAQAPEGAFVGIDVHHSHAHEIALSSTS